LGLFGSFGSRVFFSVDVVDDAADADDDAEGGDAKFGSASAFNLRRVVVGLV
jgi:hypothetical protein